MDTIARRSCIRRLRRLIRKASMRNATAATLNAGKTALQTIKATPKLSMGTRCMSFGPRRPRQVIGMPTRSRGLGKQSQGAYRAST